MKIYSYFLKDNFIFLQKIKKHSFHIVNYSPWPFIISLGLFFFFFGFVLFLYNYNSNLILISLFIIFLTIFLWFRDIIRESLYEGEHTKKVQKNLKIGFILFIFTELMFFISFFWAFLHSSLVPIYEIGCLWPPINIMTIKSSNIPLLNTIILLTSGVTFTWAHYSIIYNNKKNTILGLILTILLATFFTIIQYYEYINSSFFISDGIYGTTFFLLTGLHGFHVIIGTIFIIIILIRLINNQFTKKHHYGFEASIWYWHFVDVVWLFLFIILYWWSEI